FVHETPPAPPLDGVGPAASKEPFVQQPPFSAANQALTNAATSAGATTPFKSKSPASVPPCRLPIQRLTKNATSAGRMTPSPSQSTTAIRVITRCPLPVAAPEAPP